MERGELPFKQINWLQDEDGYYFNIRTDTGIYDIRPENTAIFRFGKSDLDHVYRITEDEGEYVFNQIPIRNGTAYFRGKEYKAE